ncbi:hypothetical protein MNV49_002500 [Pseudohyphozyma bogoriensis]|nr:hypothetical protein MNV49_002500 [Pseudohyphozyma bogoriensis]
MSPPKTTSPGLKRSLSPPVVPSHRPKGALAKRNSSGGTTVGGGAGAAHPQERATGPTEDELDQFAEVCRRLYFDRDSSAAQSVDSILQRLPASSRQAYARTMASIRSSFHLHESIKQRQLVESTLASVKPSSTIREALQISEGGLAAMRSKKARKERRKRLEAFVKAHCGVGGLVGTHPFFRSLYAVLMLQAMEAGKGGAGRRRVTWEVDVAVFGEAGGGTWMRDAVECLKGVLGFSEEIKESESRPQSYFEEEDDDEERSALAPPPPLDATHDSSDDYSASEPATSPSTSPPSLPPRNPLSSSQSSKTSTKSNKPPPPQVPPHRGSLRTRSTSDPFLDPGDRDREKRTPVEKGPLSPPSPELGSEPASPVPTGVAATRKYSNTSNGGTSSGLQSPLLASYSPVGGMGTASGDQQPPPQQFRLFTLPPYLTDPELRDLAGLFPDFIKEKARSARFKAAGVVGGRKADEESVLSGTGGGGSAGEGVKVGHGEVSVGVGLRDEGWRGTTWERFVGWLKGVFGMR